MPPLCLAFSRRLSASVTMALLVMASLQPCLADPFTGHTTVPVKRNGAYTDYPTVTLDNLPPDIAAKTDIGLDPYGGLATRKAKATGFFYALQIDGRWWLVDPDGGLFIDKAVVGVNPLHTPGAEDAFKAKFGDETRWAAQTVTMLHDLGFDGTGAWSDNATLRPSPHPLAYTIILNFMGDYGKKHGGTYQQPGHLGYPKECLFVFDPAFESFCEEEARRLDATRDDPWLLGTFSDNELPFQRECLANYLTFPEDDPGRKAAQEWLRQKHGPNATAQEITDQDKEEFLGVVVDRYCRLVSQAIKRHDPHHLYLGPRIYGHALGFSEIFQALGPYLDVISANYYGAWSPRPKDLTMWTERSGKPVLITEWYAKGEDSGMGNRGGAGFVVKTQRDRGEFYQNFTLGLLQSKACVGWQWFKYLDNDPADTKADPSNRDSNKGLLNARYEPYPPLIEAMKALNERVYTLEDYFSKTR